MRMKLQIFIHDHLTSFRTIILGFVALILVGTGLLCLPFASANGQSVPFINALFTSTSAACVTGLVVYDTATQWSLFGKYVILFLIQIGGLGVITALIGTMMLTGRKIGILSRLAMQDSISAPNTGGIIRFTKFFIKTTFLFEGIGALCLSPVFIRDFGVIRGISYAVFHSVSAFCNAGFDLMGIKSSFSSMTGYASSITVNLVLCLLIIVGGLGFLTWQDLIEHHFRFKQLRLQTKVIIVTTGILIFLPFLYFFFIEFANEEWRTRALMSLFQSVTPRTAGFNTADYGSMSEGTLFITILLMLTGGAPGSTAGGMKVTTLAVILLSSSAFSRQKTSVSVFRRRIEEQTIHHAYSLLVLYLVLFLTGTLVMCAMEPYTLTECMFECASALGTVGLTTGITPHLGIVSRIILCGYMFFGRVGGLTLGYAMTSVRRNMNNKYPNEKITVG